ncbi:hypothetical protein PRUPE_4G077700 [Prunus persica]|uniref:Uncharacterized protein n=1 Tax=Prunus persica TaxID=3760 RepID=M5WQA4_PRUPE|nr:agamous-like MADS-box protein AGL62 [Prunus persica]ONI10945.1 hypothetical protein PRUPE_4G077700 [Prunus persica]
MASEGKKTRGRQRIEMKRIEKEDDLLVSFSKRRSGISKKASDMVTLCGGEVAIVIFSPSSKPFSFGHPSIDVVINRFLNRNPLENNEHTHQIMEVHRNMRIADLIQLFNELLIQLEALKEQSKLLEKISKTRGNNQEFWWNASLDELDVNELKQTYASMAELHMTITNHLKERRNAFDASSSSAQQTNPNFDTNPSGLGSYAFPPSYGH